MRVKFWRFVHDRAERLSSWTYENKLPEGIEQRLLQKLRARMYVTQHLYRISINTTKRG